MTSTRLRPKRHDAICESIQLALDLPLDLKQETRDKVAEAVASAHLLLHCADAEPFGMALVEAMAAGRPVVAADNAGPLTVNVTSGADIVCVITNTRETGQIEVRKDLEPNSDSGLFNLQIDGVTHAADVGGALAFAGNDQRQGSELWRSDGTPEGTTLVLDLCASPMCMKGWDRPFVVGDRIVFLHRLSLRVGMGRLMPLWAARLYAGLYRQASEPTNFSGSLVDSSR